MMSALTFLGLLATLNLFNVQAKIINDIDFSRAENKILRKMSFTCLTQTDVEAMVGHQFPAAHAIAFVHDLADAAQTQILLEELRSVLHLRPQPYDFFGNGTEQFANGSAIGNRTHKLLANANAVRAVMERLRRWLPSEVATAEAFFDRRLPKIRAFIRLSLSVGEESGELNSMSMVQLFNKATSAFYQSLSAVRRSLISPHKLKCRRWKLPSNNDGARAAYIWTVGIGGLSTSFPFKGLFDNNFEYPCKHYEDEVVKIALSEQDVEDMNGNTYPFKMAQFTKHLASTAIEEIGIEEFRRRTHLRPQPYTFDEDVDEKPDSGVSYIEEVWDNLDKVLKERQLIHIDLQRPWLPSEVETAVNFLDRRLPVIRELFRRRLEEVVDEPIDEKTSALLSSSFACTKSQITDALEEALNHV